MAPIKNIAHDIGSTERLRQQDRVSSPKSGKTTKQGQVKEDAPVEARKDSVAISSAGRELAQTRSTATARYQELLASLKNGDGEKTQRVRSRIAQGEFDKPEVLESVAAAISNLPTFRSLASAPPTGDSREVLGAIAKRVRDGAYNSDEVLGRVATNILKDIGTA